MMLALLQLLGSLTAAAPGPLEQWHLSADIPISPNGALLLDDVAGLDAGAGLVPLAFHPLPAPADLVALDVGDPQQALLCSDIPVPLSTGGASRRGDVLAWDGSRLTRYFNAAAAGIPAAIGCDAVARHGDELWISFDTAFTVGVAISAADVVAWNGATLSTVFDGSAAGLGPSVDVDALSLAADGSLWMSFDGGGTVDGISFADEDVLAFHPVDGWSLVRRLSTDSERWGPANLDALSVIVIVDALFANGFE